MKSILVVSITAATIIVVAALTLSAAAQPINDTYADDAFMQGRRYYMLRSGQIKMMVQADKNGTSPAFNYLLFDAHNAANSRIKSNACNYTKDEKYFSSSLRLRMKKYAFAALGNTCETRWTNCDGIPSADAELTRQTAEKWALTNKLTSPDAVVSGLYSAITASLPGCTGSNGAIDAGMLEYGNQWVRDASMTAIGVIHTGNFELSRAVFEHILTTMVQDEGVTMIAYGWQPGAPGSVESMSSIYPDATMALPVALNVIDPASELARQTILETEKLWNRRWSFGGHDRYHTSSQGDQPGPWPFATCFILRGEHEAGMYDYSRRSLEWLYQIDGGKAGLWYEVIPLIPSGYASAGLLPWTSGEVGFFIIHHLLGVKFDGDRMTIKPNLYETTAPVKADLRYRDSRIKLEITGGNGTVNHAIVNGKKIVPDKQGRIVVPSNFTGGTISININKAKS
ncbi:hypothetical protein FACS1894199_03280 [Bacteroidia bacterium]|nr:hypothetical protein FACS1894199_03280 [Bacteroidia bacterium]